VYAGNLASVDGCKANYVTIKVANGRGGFTTSVRPDGVLPCNVTLGLEARHFYNLLKTTFAGTAAPHKIALAQYQSDGTPLSEIVVEEAVITGFTVPPLDKTRGGAFFVSAEIQSRNQNIHVDSPSPALTTGLHLDPGQASSLAVAVQNVAGSPAVSTEAFTWHQAVVRNSLSGGGFVLGLLAADFTDLGAAVSDPTALVDLSTWQRDTEAGASGALRTGSFQFDDGFFPTVPPTNTLKFTFAHMVMTSPPDPLDRAGGRHNYSMHADTVTFDRI